MKVREICKVLFFIVLSMCLSTTTFAHSGRTDANGGHYNRKTGEYHYHNGGGSSSSSSFGSSSGYNAPKTVYATDVEVSNMPTNLNVGESTRLEGSVYPSNADDQDISWESSNTQVATVDSNGNLRAVGVGSAVITAETSNGITAEYEINISEVAAQAISIAGKTPNIQIGNNTQLSVVFVPENTTFKNIEWRSDNENIVSVDQTGKLSALNIGKTTVSAIHDELVDSFEIEVTPINAKSIEISCINKDTNEKYEQLRFEVGSSVSLDAIVSLDNTTDKTVQWTVNDPEIAEIDANGILTGRSRGTITVIASTSNGITDEIEVEFYAPYYIMYFIIALAIVTIIVVIIKFFKKKTTGEPHA